MTHLLCPDCAGEVMTKRIGYSLRLFACQECNLVAWGTDHMPHETVREMWNRWCWERREGDA